MSIETIGAVLGLALLDTLSPTVIGITLYLLLARPRRVGALLAVYLGSVAVAYFALGALLMLGLGAVVPHVDETAWAWGQAVLGAGLIVGSYFIPGEKPERASVRARSFTLRSMLLLGLGTWLFEFATAVPYFGAIGIMTSAGLSAVQWSPLLGAYVTIMILPGILLYAAWAALGERLRARFERWRDKVSSGSRTMVSWIVWIAGCLILLEAVDTLFTEVTVVTPWS
ncbi:cytochrome c biogenesis protein CcdA [Thermocatellispora tengchongensis]|uniref:Cytochrome c biogenesis protein CcdA n=1 Tax=Thermocatellispora tengchongensis TaxID=1073253 RepID=A0A840PIN9_9ACTN|nr:GAP family protein [Thermocatellispora tengchongensis]MBB5137773.1 cytochrome c biogenesis protein CcdA [Thermocatellispora tengchongensis]